MVAIVIPSEFYDDDEEWKFQKLSHIEDITNMRRAVI